MLKSIIRTLLQKFIDDIDSDNCNITMEQQSKIISVLSNIANPDQRMSKIQACDYLGVSRATFDNYVRDGFIPKGIKQEGNLQILITMRRTMLKCIYVKSLVLTHILKKLLI